jgi:hypothetical protein
VTDRHDCPQWSTVAWSVKLLHATSQFVTKRSLNKPFAADDTLLPRRRGITLPGSLVGEVVRDLR